MDFHSGFGFQQGVDTAKFYTTTTATLCNKISAIAVASGAAPHRCCEKHKWDSKKECKLKDPGAQSASVCPTWGGVWVPPETTTAKVWDAKEIFGCFHWEDHKGKITVYVSTNEEQKKNCGQEGYKRCICLQPCNTGTYGSYDHKDCQSCVAGRYSDKTGLVKTSDDLPCAFCPKGKWQDTAGSTSCKDW